LLNRDITVLSDHNCLQFLLKGKNLSNQLLRYLEFLAGYQLTIKFLPGKSNQIADFLSRIRPCDRGNTPCRQCRGHAHANEYQRPDEIEMA